MGSLPRSFVRAHVVPAVLLPGLLIVSERLGLLGAEADRADLSVRDTQVAEVLARGVGAPLPEREVVLARPPLVAVSGDAHLQLRVAAQDLRHRAQPLFGLRGQGRLVELEEEADAAEIGDRLVELRLP